MKRLVTLGKNVGSLNHEIVLGTKKYTFTVLGMTLMCIMSYRASWKSWHCTRLVAVCRISSDKDRMLF